MKRVPLLLTDNVRVGRYRKTEDACDIVMNAMLGKEGVKLGKRKQFHSIDALNTLCSFGATGFGWIQFLLSATPI